MSSKLHPTAPKAKAGLAKVAAKKTRKCPEQSKAMTSMTTLGYGLTLVVIVLFMLSDVLIGG